ncbi:catechol 2,3-dioxygenase [soil metagenome]
MSTAQDMSEIGIRPPHYRLPASAHIGRVRLAVSELERSVAFYRDVIGLQVLREEDRMVQLGAQGCGRVLLELQEMPGVSAIGRRTRLGLYHTAFLLPSREALSSFVQHLTKLGVPFGAGDHIYSEALYLTDPDGLQVEVYADRPQDQWIFEGREIVSATGPVHFETMPTVAEDSWQGAPAGTTVGHVHLYIEDLKAAEKFYIGALGLDIVTWRYPGALFTSAGGYHHHVGLNVWAAGSPVATEQDARLLFWEMVLPDADEIDRAAASLSLGDFDEINTENGARAFRDPWGIVVALVEA